MLVIDASHFVTARQAIAMALSLRKECTVTLHESIQHLHFSRTLHAVKEVLQRLSVNITFDSGSITVIPAPLQAFTAAINLHPFCPIADVFLTIAPALTVNPVQSDIAFQGVTHCQYSHSTGFIRYGLAPLLQRCGIYLHSATQLFGFYSAAGRAVAKVYPSKKNIVHSTNAHTHITGIRIYIANIDHQFAMHQKSTLSRLLALGQEAISIIQIANVNNHGNAVDVFFSTGGLPSMLSFTMPLYDEEGNFSFDDDMMQKFLETVYSACAKNYDYIPLPVVEESLPFIISAGLDYRIAETFNPGIAGTDTYKLCALFSDY